MSPSSFLRCFLLELLPSELAGVDVGHMVVVIPGNKPVKQHLSLADIFKLCSSAFLPENTILDTCPCALWALLSTSLPHYPSCCASLEASSVLPAPSAQRMHWSPPPPNQGPHGAPRAPCRGGQVPARVAAAPVSFPQHPQRCWDTRLRLSQPTWPPLASLIPEATLCYDTNHLLWGTKPGRFPVWDSRNNGQWQGKHTGWVSNKVPGNESGLTTRGEGYERHGPQLPALLWCQLGFFSYVLYPLCYRLYLQHHHTDLFDTLDNCVGCPRDCHRPLRGVGQHVPRHLNLSTC